MEISSRSGDRAAAHRRIGSPRWKRSRPGQGVFCGSLSGEVRDCWRSSLSEAGRKSGAASSIAALPMLPGSMDEGGPGIRAQRGKWSVSRFVVLEERMMKNRDGRDRCSAEGERSPWQSAARAVDVADRAQRYEVHPENQIYAGEAAQEQAAREFDMVWARCRTSAR